MVHIIRILCVLTMRKRSQPPQELPSWSVCALPMLQQHGLEHGVLHLCLSYHLTQVGA
jgi:hypothetical protein